MSELSDADRGGSRQTRRGASMARSIASKQRVDASDEARRRGSAMDGAGDAGRGTVMRRRNAQHFEGKLRAKREPEGRASGRASKSRRQASPSALESAKRGHDRPRQPRGAILGQADSAGLRPEDILVYVERSKGRRSRRLRHREHGWGERGRTLTGTQARTAHNTVTQTTHTL